MGVFCYMLECADGSYYTGWTTDPVRRTKMHNQSRGAKYTRTHLPVKLVYVEELTNRSSAMKRERIIKTYSHERKSKMASIWMEQNIQPSENGQRITTFSG
jgi:putative endonuclease